MNIEFEENKDADVEKTENLKKRKIRAWCSECFQTFENGPLSKQCLDHFHKNKCNLIECRKKNLKNERKCIRRFKNINSENRHTYCIDDEEIKKWNNNIQIQHCVNNLPKEFIENKREICKKSIKNLINTKDNQKDTKKKIKEKANLFQSDKILNNNFFECEKDKTGDHDMNHISETNQIYLENFLNAEKFKNLENDYDINIDHSEIFCNKFDNPTNIHFNDFNFEINSKNLDKIDSNFNQRTESIFSVDSNKNKFKNFPQNFKHSEEKSSLSDTRLNKSYLNIFDNNKLILNGDSKRNGNESLNEYPLKRFSTEKFFEKKSVDLEEDSLISQLDKVEFIEKSNLKNNKKNYNSSNSLLLSEFSNKVNRENNLTNLNNFMIYDNMDIDVLFNLINQNQKISLEVLNKIRNELKSKGFNTILSLRLKKEKYGSWKFLFDDYKDLSKEIEALALIMEFYLEKKI